MLNKLKSDIFLRRYAIYFSGSMVVAFLNYIFYPILGRLLSPANFGDVEALISLISQAGIIFGAFSMVVINITANTEDPAERDAIITELQKIAFWIIGIIFVILLFSLTTVRTFFHFSTIYPLLGLAIILPITAVVTFRNAYLQGSGRFKDLSFAGIISSSGRLIFVTALVLLGAGVFGATVGIVLANVALLIYLIYKTKDTLHLGAKTNVHILEKGSVARELRFGGLVLFASGLITLFSTADVLIVKHCLNPVDAGLYSGISVIAGILFFAIGPSAAVLLSSVKIKNSFKENAKPLKKAFILSLIIAVVGLFTFYKFNDMVVKVMIGAKYAQYAYFLPKAGLMMLLAALTNIFIYYFLALRRFFLIVIALIGMVLLGSIFWRDHSTIDIILNNLIISLVIVIIPLIIIYAKDYFNSHTDLQ